MYNYPVGNSVPPPTGSGGQYQPSGQPGGSGWSASSGSWAPPSGSWAPPSGSWAPPTNSWGGGYPQQPSGYNPQPNPGVYPPQPGGNYHSDGSYPPQAPPGGSYPPQPPPGASYPPQTLSGGTYPPQPSSGGTYPSQPSGGGWRYPASPGGYPPQPSGYPSQPIPTPFASGGGYPSAPSAPYSPDPIIPSIVPSVKPAAVVNYKGVSPTDYDSAIQFFREMASKENMPEEGKNAFLKLAGDDGEIDAFELQDILNKVFLKDFQFDGFSSDMTRSMVAMRDFDMSGKLGYDDFKKLWADLALCKKAFIALDENNSGAFSKTEFQRAISTMGLTITPKAQQALIMRYSDKDGNIRFDDFVSAYIKLKTMMKTFRGKDRTNKGVAEFEKDEYVQLAMYA